MSSGKRLRVGVLFGGRSGEHEVSLASAASVIRALDPERYEAVPIGISKDGRWLAGTKANQMLPEVLKKGERVSLPPDPTAGALLPISQGAGRPSIAVDVMFPVLHGTFGEDGTVQGLLNWRDCRTWARECWAPQLAWTKMCRSDCSSRRGCQ